MRIRLIVVGRLKDGPERELVDDYLDRARKMGAQMGYRSIEEIEIVQSDPAAEGKAILAKVGDARIALLDERGETIKSTELSHRLFVLRDAGQDLAFIIGGADGTSDEVKKRAGTTLSFGKATWPHKLVRVMLAEQIYRALSIEAGTPYHRE
jgi:23S rRNA (pseudouridine1915-N3)-methyltransferase